MQLGKVKKENSGCTKSDKINQQIVLPPLGKRAICWVQIKSEKLRFLNSYSENCFCLSIFGCKLNNFYASFIRIVHFNHTLKKVARFIKLFALHQSSNCYDSNDCQYLLLTCLDDRRRQYYIASLISYCVFFPVHSSFTSANWLYKIWIISDTLIRRFSIPSSYLTCP